MFCSEQYHASHENKEIMFNSHFSSFTHVKTKHNVKMKVNALFEHCAVISPLMVNLSLPRASKSSYN